MEEIFELIVGWCDHQDVYRVRDRREKRRRTTNSGRDGYGLRADVQAERSADGNGAGNQRRHLAPHQLRQPRG